MSHKGIILLGVFLAVIGIILFFLRVTSPACPGFCWAVVIAAPYWELGAAIFTVGFTTIIVGIAMPSSDDIYETVPHYGTDISQLQTKVRELEERLNQKKSGM